MVIFLNVNYLEQTVSTRQQLLATCLLSVPSHLDNIESYIHRGCLPDDKYRFPWKRGRADEHFLLEQSTRHFKDLCLLQPPEHKSGLFIEPYTDVRCAVDDTVENRAWSEGVTFSLDCDLIPSSNPSSGQDSIFTPDDFFTDKTLFQEFFLKEDLKHFDSNNDGYMLEESVQLQNEGTDILGHRPTLGALVSRLSTEEMEDPFKDATDINQNEKQYLTAEDGDIGTRLIEQHYDATLFNEEFHKELIEGDNALETPLAAGSSIRNSAEVREIQATLLANLTEKVHLEQDTDDVREVLINTFGTQKVQQDCGQHAPLSLARGLKSIVNFLDVNEIILTENDKFCEAAVLDTPQQSPEVKHKPILSVPERQAIDVSCPQSMFLTREEKVVLMQSLWQNEKYCDNVPASVLPEPKLPADQPFKMITCLRNALKFCRVQPASTGQLELGLSWDIVSYTSVVCNPCTHLAIVSTDPDGLERPSIAEIEAFQRYDCSSMLDWQDPQISVKSCVDVKQPTIVMIDKGAAIQQKSKGTVRKQQSINTADPLSCFMALRSKQPDIIRDQLPNYQQTAKTSAPFPQTEVKTVISEGLKYQDKIKANFEQVKRIKHHTVKIQLSDELLVIIQLLRSQSASFIQNLRQTEVLPTGSRFENITPDITRFLLKQREKYLADNTINIHSDDIYKNVLSLHALSVACDTATNCCLESAIAYLASMYEKYHDIVAGNLDNVRQQMFELKAQFLQKKICHPKIASVCKEIETWLKKKQAKSRDQEQKMLILVRREMPTLLQCLQNALYLGKLLCPGILTSPQSEDIIDALDQHNCLISPQRLITDNFPWAQFCLVVEYERVEKSPWQQLCERQNIRHIDFQMELVHHPDESVKTEWNMKYPDHQIILVASQQVTTNIPLLQLLEARFNILLVERDYSLFKSAGRQCYFSDVDVDESTGIVQCDVADMSDGIKVQELVTRIAALSLKYTNIWVLVASLKKTNCYQFPGHVINNMSRLHAAVANLVQKKEDFFVKIILCENTEEVAFYVRNISESVMESKNERTWSDWLERTWISQDLTEKEKFLLSLPCMSSFNAQLMASNLKMGQIFQLTVDQLAANLKWVPRKVLESLTVYGNQKSGLQKLQDSNFERAMPDEENDDETEYRVAKVTACMLPRTGTHSNAISDRCNSECLPVSDVEFSTKNADFSRRENGRRWDQRSVSLTSSSNHPRRSHSNTTGTYVCGAGSGGGEPLSSEIVGDNVTIQSNNGLVFDYNHGLPWNAKRTFIDENPAVRHGSVGDGSCPETAGSHKHQDSGSNGRLSRREIELEFPSAEEIDMSIQNERVDDSYKQVSQNNVDNVGFDMLHTDRCTVSQDNQTCDSSGVSYIPYLSYDEANTKNCYVDRCSEIGTLPKNDVTLNCHYSSVASSTFTETPSIEKLVKKFTDGTFQNEDFPNDVNEIHSRTTERSEVRFDFNPKIIDISDPNSDISCSSVDETDVKKTKLFEREIGRSKNLYLNPEIDRLTIRKELQQNVVSTPQTRSLEDDLRETTRKLIENSQQFARFGKRTSRSKLCIGLAQPQQRQTPRDAGKISGNLLASEAERLRMVQSPWATENSPPMDLDYENREIERVLYPGSEDVTNRTSVTHSTPMKKLRLTYQKMPGLTGQTKLVFQ